MELSWWFLKNVRHLNAKIERLTWIDKLIPGATDVAVTVEIDGLSHQGWGWGFGEDLALTKAVAEALERSIIQEHSLVNSNGVAAHLSFDKASKGAKNELLERHLFMSHFLTKTPYLSFDLLADEDPRLLRAVDWFERKHCKVSFFHLGKHGVLCVIRGESANPRFGLISGAALKETKSESTMAAFIEAARRAYNILESGVVDSISPMEFNAIKRPSVQDHGRLGRNIQYMTNIEYLFNRSPNRGMQDFLEDQIRVEELKTRQAIIADSPLVFVRAHSSEVQSLFFGFTAPEKVNLNALIKFCSRRIDWRELNSEPHFFD